MFADQGKSLCFDTFGASLLETEQDEFEPQHHSYQYHFPSLDLGLETSVSLHNKNSLKRLTYELKLSNFSTSYVVFYYLLFYRFSLNIATLCNVGFPPPFKAILLSTRIKIQTSNEYLASVAFLEILTGLKVHEVIIFGAADGSVFALSTGDFIELRRIFNFPLPSPISDFAMLYHVSSTVVDSVDTDIEECLIAISIGGLVAACYSDNLQ